MEYILLKFLVCILLSYTYFNKFTTLTHVEFTFFVVGPINLRINLVINSLLGVDFS